jgi:hypothetical protein
VGFLAGNGLQRHHTGFVNELIKAAGGIANVFLDAASHHALGGRHRVARVADCAASALETDLRLASSSR